MTDHWYGDVGQTNKLRQSYVKGFIDISGGDLKVRNDNNLKFFSGDASNVSKLTMNATEYVVEGKRFESEASESDITVDNSKLAFLKDLSDNAQFQMDQLFNTTKFIATDGSANATTLINLTGGEIKVSGDIVPTAGETYNLGSEALPFNSLYLKNQTIYFDTNDPGAGTNTYSAFSFNEVTGQLDLSFNDKIGSTVLSYEDKVAIGYHPNNSVPGAYLDVSGSSLFQGTINVLSGDISLNDNLSVGGTASINSTLAVVGATTLSNTLDVTGATTLSDTLGVTGATTLSSTLGVAKTATMSSNLVVGMDASLNSTLNVADAATMESTLGVTGATTLSSTLDVVESVTIGTTLDVTGMAHIGSNLDVSGNLTIDGNLRVNKIDDVYTINTTINNYDIVITEDISLNGSMFASGDVSLNAGLFVNEDASFNSHLFIGDDASFNSRLYVVSDVTTDSHIKVGGDASLNAKLFVNEDASLNANLNVGVNVFVGGIVDQW